METTNHLNPRYAKIQDMCMQGLKPGQIAERLGLTLPWVSTVINSPNFQHQLSIRRKAFEEVHDQQVINSEKEAADVLKENARRAAQKMVDLLDGDKQEIQIKAAGDILDRVGPSKQTKNENTNSNVVLIDAKMATVINETFEMDN